VAEQSSEPTPEGLTEAERKALQAAMRVQQAIAPDAACIYAAVDRILADHLAAVQAERDRLLRTMRAQDAANDALMAERDALRETVRAVADSLDGNYPSFTVALVVTRLRAALEGGRS
jgi:hypothetical protein